MGLSLFMTAVVVTYPDTKENAMSDTKNLLIYGNPVDGFNFAGPFNDGPEEMEQWLQDNGWSGGDWWTAEVTSPYQGPPSWAAAFSEREGRLATSPKSQSYIEESQKKYDAAVVRWLEDLHGAYKNTKVYVTGREAAIVHQFAHEKCLGGDADTIHISDEDQIDVYKNWVLFSTTSGPEPLWALEFENDEAARRAMDAFRGRTRTLQSGWPREVLPG